MSSGGGPMCDSTCSDSKGSNDEIDFTENRISLSLARRFE
jgi:hypothetical protein